MISQTSRIRRGALLALLLVLSLFAGSSASVWAQGTVLTTVVPGDIHISVEISGRGSVGIGSRTLTKSGNVVLPFQREVAVTVNPEDGARISRIVWNGADVTSLLKSGQLKLSEFHATDTLKVIFEDVQGAPKTGDAVSLTLLFGAGSAAALWLTRRSRTR